MAEQTNKTPMDLRILIVGGAGFIGSHLAENWLNAGAQVCVFDNFSTGQREFLPANHAGLSIQVGDIRDSAGVLACFQSFKPDCVYHLAAVHFIPACEKDPDQAFAININGTQHVLKACAQVKPARVVFASSGAIYDIIDTPLAETSPVRPRDIYGITKVTGENLCDYYAMRHNLSIVVARLFNAVGARETNPHVVPEIIKQMANNNHIIELGNLEPKRDYVAVRDIAGALFSCGNLNVSVGLETVNIGSAKEYSVKDLVETLSRISQRPLEIRQVAERMRKADRLHQLADIMKLQTLFEYQPAHTLQEALSDALADILNRKAFNF